MVSPTRTENTSKAGQPSPSESTVALNPTANPAGKEPRAIASLISVISTVPAVGLGMTAGLSSAYQLSSEAITSVEPVSTVSGD